MIMKKKKIEIPRSNIVWTVARDCYKNLAEKESQLYKDIGFENRIFSEKSHVHGMTSQKTMNSTISKVHHRCYTSSLESH